MLFQWNEFVKVAVTLNDIAEFVANRLIQTKMELFLASWESARLEIDRITFQFTPHSQFKIGKVSFVFFASSIKHVTQMTWQMI